MTESENGWPTATMRSGSGCWVIVGIGNGLRGVVFRNTEMLLSFGVPTAISTSPSPSKSLAVLPPSYKMNQPRSVGIG